jgi:hypothetical protein
MVLPSFFEAYLEVLELGVLFSTSIAIFATTNRKSKKGKDLVVEEDSQVMSPHFVRPYDWK